MAIEARRFGLWSDEARDRALTAMLIVQCLAIFIAMPAATTGYPGSRIVVELLLAVFAALVIVVARGRITMAVAALAVIISLLGVLVYLFEPLPSLVFLARIGNVVGALVVATVVGRAVIAPGKVTSHRVIGAIVVYLTVGMIFETLYRLIWAVDPGSLSGIPTEMDPLHAGGIFLYYSFATLTTLGYGDILPIHPLARSLANLEAIIGQLYPATLLARLVTLELEARRG